MNEYETTPQDPAPETAQRDLSRDLGGLVLFALAIFLGVSVVMAASKPELEAGGITALVTSFVRLLGTWPLLVLSACLGFLGARVWIAGATEGLWRNAGWSVLLALALALAFGAASAGAGGSFGDSTGGALSALASAWLGVPLALAVVGAVVWFAWLRPPEWKPVLSPDEPAPSVYAPSDTEGLTADEAEALLPSEVPEEVLQGEVTGRSIPVAPDLPPLYPPDVRREGRIPDGARALETRDEPAPRTAPDAPARPEPTPAPAGLAGEPVAEPARGAAHQAAPEPVQPPAGALAQGGAGSAVEDLAPAAVPRWERPRDLGRGPVVEEEPAPLRAGASLHISTSPVRSAWESEVEEEEGLVGAGDAEDAEEFAEDAEEGEGVLASAVVDDEHADESDEAEEELDEDEVYAEDDSEDVEDAEEEFESDEEDEDAEAELDEDEESDESDEDEAAELEDDDEPEAFESEEEDLEVHAEVEDDDEPEEDPEVLGEAPVDEAPLAEDPELVADVAAAATAADSEPPAPRPGRAAWEQAGLFDDEPVDAYGTPVELVEALRQANHETAARIAEPEVESAVEPEVAGASPETEVELRPQPRAEKPRASKPKAKAAKQPAHEPPAAAPAPEDDLVFRAGMLFVERGRVAVSMLQRTFDLDFKQATALLDQLQDAGLIGPYLGGQKRDILLSADEWRERRVAAH